MASDVDLAKFMPGYKEPRNLVALFLAEKYSTTIEELEDTFDFNEPLLQFIESWDELTKDATPTEANIAIWKIYSFPFFLFMQCKTDEHIGRLLAASKLLTLSIPRIHPRDEPMENGFYMMWDILAGGFFNDVSILAELVEHPDQRVQLAALHGLGHRGDDRIPILETYAKNHPDVWDNEWFKQCLDGSVM